MRFKKKFTDYLCGSLLILISTGIAFIFPGESFLASQETIDVGVNAEGENQGLSVISWKLLQKLDYKSSVVPEDLQKYLNTKVKIPGFAVPLDDDSEHVREFLFVPNQMACIHVPAPPPHLVIYVILEKSLPIENLSGPLWLAGLLELEAVDSSYGSAAFKMQGHEVRPYTYDT